MRILVAVHNFPPEFAGGVERHVEELCLSLQAAECEILVFAGSARDVEIATLENEEWRGIQLRRYRRSGAYNNLVDEHDTDAEGFFEAVLSDFEPNLVHIHHWHRLSSNLAQLASQQNIPSVISLHDLWTSCAQFFRLPGPAPKGGPSAQEGMTLGEEPCFKLESEKDCIPCLSARFPLDPAIAAHSLAVRRQDIATELDLAQAILVPSQSLRRDLETFKVLDPGLLSKTQVLPLPAKTIDLQGLEPNESGDSAKEFVVAHWGNLSSAKGVALLLTALARVQVKAKVRLKLLGPILDAKLKVLIEEKHWPFELEYLGAYTPADLPRLLADVQLAVFPSYALETHSLVVDEALQLDIPLIVSDRGAMTERMGGRGVAFPAGDEAALVALTEKLAQAEVRVEITAAKKPILTTPAEYKEAILAVYRQACQAKPHQVLIGNNSQRERLAFRNRGMLPLSQLMSSLRSQLDLAEAAMDGCPESLASLALMRPELAQKIRALLGKNSS